MGFCKRIMKPVFPTAITGVTATHNIFEIIHFWPRYLQKRCLKLTEMLMPRLPDIFLSSTVISSGLTQFREGDRGQPSWDQHRLILYTFTSVCLWAWKGSLTLTCVPGTRTSRGTCNLLLAFGVIMTETISSRLSSADRPSITSVDWDSYFLNTGERTLLGLMGTMGEKKDKHQNVVMLFYIR